MSEAVFVEGLTKTYNGKTVVNHLNLSVKSGTVFGLLGANGAEAQPAGHEYGDLRWEEREVESIFFVHACHNHRNSDRITANFSVHISNRDLGRGAYGHFVQSGEPEV